MFYEDYLILEDEYSDKHKKYASTFSSIFELKREKSFMHYTQPYRVPRNT